MKRKKETNLGREEREREKERVRGFKQKRWGEGVGERAEEEAEER